MRIGLDARNLFSPRPRGTGRNLLDAYRLIPKLRPDWEFILYHQRPLEPDALPCCENVLTRRIDLPGDRFESWLHLRLPLAARRDRLDLLHLPANTAPARCSVPFVATIHDLIPLKVAGECSESRQRAFRTGVQRAVRRAAHIITVSSATRDDLQRDFGVSPKRMTVIPWAPDSALSPARDESRERDRIENVRRRYDLTDPWLLNFSGASRRKNAHGLLEALPFMPPPLRDRLQVVLVGCEPAEFRTGLETQAERLGVRSHCRFLEFVPAEDLPGLLRGAAGLLMPSLYEGFGLPILDAFACGTPVLAARVSSMPEVAGDAAIYCDPHSPRSIAAGIAELLDPDVSIDLVQRGAERVKAFTWERTAEAMCRVYESAADSRAFANACTPVLVETQLEPIAAAGGGR